MRIYFYLPNLEIGGAQRNIINLANVCFKNNIQVKIIVNNNIGHLKNKLNKKIKIISLNNKNRIYNIYKVRQILKNEKPSHLISILECNAIACFAKILLINKTVIVNRICNTMSAFLNSKKNIFNYYYHFYLNYFIYKFSDKIILQNQYMKSDFYVIFKIISSKKIYILNNILDIEEINSKSNQIHNFHFTKNKFSKIFVTTCTIRKQKNLFDMVTIFQSIIKDNQNCYLIIVGDGELKKDLKKFINNMNLSSNIFITGFEDNPYKIISKCDFYISTSKFEGTSNSILEALSLGIPIISSNYPSGNSEIINKDNGILVDQTDLINNFRIVIKKVINKELFFKKKEAISEPIIKNYNFDIVFTNLLLILND
tara:strand:+ start:425 stop:1534 length:1110 start_codon:yes stop_codon:yes gene_type:complete